MTTTDPVHWAAAGAAVGLWLALTLATVWRAFRVRRAERARSNAMATEAGGGATLVAFASQTGMAEDLARMTARALTEAGETAMVVSFAELDLAMLKAARRALFVVATTGEGDAPDSAARVVRRLMGEATSLPDLTYGMLALGDRSYKDYCGFAHAVDGWLKRSGAEPLFDMVEVDDADPDAIRQWQHQLNALTGSNAAADWTPATHQPWRLEARTLVNPGGPGGEAWRLRLVPVGTLPDWRAGDIAEIGVPGPDGGKSLAARDYSIASLPSEGGLELLVRLMSHPDGTPGLASGWLTKTLEVGGDVPIRIRTNSGFHGPSAATPMILIGNGTGIAGLRAHLVERPGGEAWLMFGERSRAHDAFFDDDLQAWLGDGRLTRLDRTFSRDANDGRYVQALIDEHAAEVRAWIDRGAAVYVCGSLEGMATGVHAALERALGSDALIALSEHGRYRRDIY
ncbi:sulfite reductase subunit alpha [Brevundimonas sp.]|uniref:sulfite reductase subunit alpha n=1 Tax=Brevundimonas sp. TaxID=1871086 RepID=UPI00378341C6